MIVNANIVTVMIRVAVRVRLGDVVTGVEIGIIVGVGGINTRLVLLSLY